MAHADLAIFKMMSALKGGILPPMSDHEISDF